MQRKIHTFDNGIRVYDDQLMPAQRARYRIQNVHEADEEALFTTVIRSLPDNATYVNIGSAIGYYAMLAKKLAPSLNVQAIEPLVSFRQAFRENLLLNGFHETDFRLHPLAVSRRDGTSVFVEKGFESRLLSEADVRSPFSRAGCWAREHVKGLLASLGSVRYAAGRGRPNRVNTVSLDNLLARIATPVDLLSMDVQGLEAEILQGGAETLAGGRVATYIIGTHSRSLHHQCREILSGHGYTIEHDEADTRQQPDGIIIASLGVQRLRAAARES